MRRPGVILLLIVFLGACKAKELGPKAAAPKSSPPAATAPSTAGTYPAALEWFRTTRGFRFAIEEGDVSATGEMVRPSPGAERVLVRANDGEWLGAAATTGILWYRREGPGWTRDPKPPTFTDRIYERATIVLDPQKREGQARLAGSDAEMNHFRFTNAESGDVHELWVSRRDNHVAKLKIAGRIAPTSMTITPDESVNVPQP